MNDEREMTEEMGGEVGEEVKRLLKIGKIECHGICLKETPTTDIRGYPHDGGLADKNGKRYWVYVHCNNPVKRNGKRDVCGYDMSWRHIRGGE